LKTFPSQSRAFPKPRALAVGAAVALALLAGCGDQKPAEDEDSQASALDQRERELALREAEINLKEREEALARRETALNVKPDAADAAKAEEPLPSAKGAAAVAAAKPKPAPAKPKAEPKKEVAEPKVVSLPPPPPPPPPITVPPGTQLTVSLQGDLSSRTAQPGQPFEARVANSIVIDGRVAVPAGSRVLGTVTDVISGSRKIGAIPTLGLSFDSLVLPDGERVRIDGDLVEHGASERGQDSAKILGGAAAGAVLGHQVKNNNGGKILGGLLGGVLGAVAAQKTGTEVQIASGTELTIALGQSFQVKGR
jgi:hypothetical protein